jgi:hypothetical protein
MTMAEEKEKRLDYLKLVTGQNPEDLFNNVEELRKVAEHKVQRRTVAVNMSVRKPPDNAYFQCHPDPAQRLDASLLFDKEERDIYFVGPQMMNHPLVVPRLRRVTIATTYLWPSGQILLWPVPFSTGKGSVKCWRKTSDYDLAIAENINTAPIWVEDLQLSTSLKLGFRDKTIVDEDHAYMRQLRGLTE